MNPTDSRILRDETLLDRLNRHALERPAATVFRFLDADGACVEEMSFAQLRESALRIAHVVHEGLAPGDRALVLYPPGLEFIRVFVACLYAGIVPVPVYLPNMRQDNWDRLAAIARDSGSRALFGDATSLDGAVHRLADAGVSSVRALTPVARANAPAMPASPTVDLETVAFLQYTSGSTGDPKGVVVTHANIADNERRIEALFGHDTSTIVVGWLPQYHDMGLIGNILQPLWLGATAVLMSPVAFLQKPVRWLEAVSRWGATTSGAPDFAYRLCAERVSAEDKAGLDLSRWTLAFNGAEPVRQATLDAFAEAFAGCGFDQRAFYPCYGLAESTLIATGGQRLHGAVTRHFERGSVEAGFPTPVAVSTAPGDRAEVALVSSGQASDDERLRIVDPGTGRECAVGAVGEIWLAGPSVARGYWNRTELTCETFEAMHDGRRWLRTGDLGFVLDGELFVTGRLKDLVIIRGRNYYPQDVEGALQARFASLRTGGGACFAVLDGDEERMALVHEVERGALRGVDLGALAEEIAQHIVESFGVRPLGVTLIKPTALPRTSSGKVRRITCRGRFERDEFDPVATWRDGGPASAANLSDHAFTASAGGVLEILSSVLATDAARHDPSRSLSACGLDSLRAADLEHRLASGLGLRIDMTRLLFDMTIERLVAEAAAVRPEGIASEVPDAQDTPSNACSWQERSIWQIQTMFPEARSYHVGLPLRLQVALDAGALAEALARLARRHNALATSYAVDAVSGDARRVVGAAPSLEVVDAAGWTSAAVVACIDSRTAAEIDLAKGPLLRATLLRTGAADSVLHLLVHHVAVDAWSMQLLVRDLFELYADVRAGRADNRPAPPSPREFALAQARWIASEAGQAATRALRDTVGNASAVLALPADRPRPRRFEFTGGEVGFDIAPAQASAVKACAAALEVTPFVLLLAAWQVLLHRVCGASDFVVGVPVSDRPLGRFSETVGCFVDLKPFPCRPTSGITLREFVQSVRETTQQVLQLRALPGQLGLSVPDGGGWPAVAAPNVRFAYQQAQVLQGADAFLFNRPDAKCVLGGLAVASVPGIAIPGVQCDLALSLLADGASLAGKLAYNSQLFDRKRVEQLCATYGELLRSIAAEPDRPLGSLALLDAPERARQLARSAATVVDQGPAVCIHELFEAQVRRRPDAVAAVCGSRALTYGELNERANVLAHELRRCGAQPEDRVVLFLGRSTGMVVAFLAALKAGLCSVMLEPSLPQERCRYIVEDSRARLLLTDLDEPGPIALMPGLSVVDTRTIGAGNEEDRRDLGLPLASSTAAYVIYTSGSTGRPKGVIGLHAGIVNRTRWMIRHFGLGEADTVLHHTPLGFVRAEREILFPLCAGARLAVLPSEGLNRPQAVLEALELHHVTFTASSPSLLRMILDHEAAAFTALDGLRHWFIGADALRPQLVRDVRVARPDLHLTYFYGSTEVASDVAYLDIPPGATVEAVTTPIGRAVDNTSLYVLDAALEPVPDGVIGELLVGGVQLARGYLCLDELSLQKFIPDPFSRVAGARLYRTGDLAYRRADGNLVVVGRDDDQVNLYGHRVELGEIEHAIRDCGLVRDAVVLAHRRGEREHVLVAAYVTGLHEQDVGTLRERLSARMPGYMMPALFMRLDALPVTPLGKIDRGRLLAMDLSAASGVERVAPATALQGRMVTLLSALLGVPSEAIGIERNFFELGANSSLLSAFVKRLNESELPMPVRLAHVYHHHNVRELAASLAGETPNDTEQDPAVERALARRLAQGRRVTTRVN